MFLMSIVVSAYYFGVQTQKHLTGRVVQSHFVTFSYATLHYSLIVSYSQVIFLLRNLKFPWVLNLHSVSYRRPNCILPKYSLN